MTISDIRAYGGRIAVLFLCFLIAAMPSASRADSATVAVAANFATTMAQLASRFGESGEHDIRIVPGSTGKLYTQIIHGAPFDVFLAADTARPERLVAEGLAAQDAQVTYAVGRLALWSRTGAPSESLLRNGAIERLALANPALAPYGVAAMEALSHYGLTGARAPALVMGENAAQTVAMVATGNVDHGLIPLSMAQALEAKGGFHALPATVHAPIRQDAVLLKRAEGNSAAGAFFTFLQSEAARAIIVADGYGEMEP